MENFGEEYMREPTKSDLRPIMGIKAARGFPRCIIFIDCQDLEGENSLWLEWCSKRPRKNSHCGIESRLGRLNVDVACSLRLTRLTQLHELSWYFMNIFEDHGGNFRPSFPYTVNGEPLTLQFYLVDSIYPIWEIFWKEMSQAGTGNNLKENLCVLAQESFRNDIERSFCILCIHFQILHHRWCFHNRWTMAFLISMCIILSKIVFESRRDLYESSFSKLQHLNDERRMFYGGMFFKW